MVNSYDRSLPPEEYVIDVREGGSGAEIRPSIRKTESHVVEWAESFCS